MLDVSKIKAVFFDVDDTLYDQMETFRQAVQASAMPTEDLPTEVFFKQLRHHSDVLWSDYKSGALSLEKMRMLRIMNACNALNTSISEEQALHFQACYEEAQAELKMHPEAMPFIRTLLNRGITVGLLTNGPVDHQMKKLKQFQLPQLLPEHLIFISDALGIAKPDVNVFYHINKVSGVSAEACCYIGDSWENDIASSTEAGWQSIWINHRGRTPETDHRPAAVVQHFNEIPALFGV